MSYLLEVYYRPPADRGREEAISERVTRLGGRLDYRESANGGAAAVCLSYEFDDRRRAEEAAASLRNDGEHVEGPADYG